MAENSIQTYSNHTRYDPAFHFFILPALVFSLGMSSYECVLHPNSHTAWLVVFGLATLAASVRSRMYANKVQDRVIRLEERIRLTELLPDPQRAQIPRLSERQLIGLRFASDAEVPALVQRALAENLGCKEIKRSVQHWRPDYWRV